MAIRWLKNVMIDGKKGTLEIQMGDRFIGDKSYTRMNRETEQWFKNRSGNRDDVLSQGLSILKERLSGKSVTDPSGKPFGWKP
jgi:hypothetical protein